MKKAAFGRPLFTLDVFTLDVRTLHVRIQITIPSSDRRPNIHVLHVRGTLW